MRLTADKWGNAREPDTSRNERGKSNSSRSREAPQNSTGAGKSEKEREKSSSAYTWLRNLFILLSRAGERVTSIRGEQAQRVCARLRNQLLTDNFFNRTRTRFVAERDDDKNNVRVARQGHLSPLRHPWKPQERDVDLTNMAVREVAPGQNGDGWKALGEKPARAFTHTRVRQHRANSPRSCVTSGQ